MSEAGIYCVRCRKIRAWQWGVGLFVVGNLMNFGSFGKLLLPQCVALHTLMGSHHAMQLTATGMALCSICRTESSGGAWLGSVPCQCRIREAHLEGAGEDLHLPYILACV